MWRCGCEESRREDAEAWCAQCGSVNPSQSSVPEEALQALGYLAALVGPRTSLPTVDEWKRLSGLDYHVRSRSMITEVDSRLEQFWTAFAEGRKPGALQALEKLEERTRWYLSYEANKRYGALVTHPEPSQRVPVVRQLLTLVVSEKGRFERQWTGASSRPPRIWGALANTGARISANDEQAGPPRATVGEGWMDLRTHVPTVATWKALSKAGKTHLRSTSSITSVDSALEAFWKAFHSRHRANSLEKLEKLREAVRVYLSYQANKKYLTWKLNTDQSSRVPAAAQLLSVVAGELRRLEVEWREGRLPPLLDEVEAEEAPSLEDANRLAVELSREPPLASRAPQLLDTLPTVAEALRRLETASGPMDRRKVTKAMLQAQRDAARGDVVGQALDKTIAAEATWADVVSLADAINTNIQKGQADPLDFLTTSAWASSVSFLVSLLTLAATLRGMKKDGVSASGVALSTFHLGATGVRLAATTEAWHKAIHGTSALGNAATPISAAASGIGIATSLMGLVTSLKEACHVSTVGGRFTWAAEKEPQLLAALETSEPFKLFRRKVLGKLQRRSYRAKVDIATNTAGVAGGTIGLTVGVLAVTGAANVWNPVGWACIGVAALGGLGMVGYKVGRRVHKVEKLKRARPKYDIPSWVSTTGEWQRLLIADLVVRSASGDPTLPEDWNLMGRVLNWILLGGELTEAQAEARAMGHVGLMAFIKG